MVGAVDRKQAEKIANDISAVLDSGEAASELSVPARGPEVEEFVAFPSQQAHVFIGQVGIKRGDPDYFALYVGNHILGGGGFTSRLMKQVRSERGLSYSVYSYFTPLREAGPFIIGLQTRIDQAREAIDVSHSVVEEFVENGPTQEELDLSKRSIIGGFPLRMDSNRDILGYLGVIGFYDLPLTYLNDFPAKVEALSLEDIRDAFQRRVEPEKLVTVTVGGETAP